MFLWLAVTPDKYEFPIYIAERLGITASTVIASVSRNKSGINSGRKIVKVELDDT